MAAASLTGIFAPGSPPLTESLRTLVLDRKRTVAPGETIAVEFSFSNLGGAAATGLRTRFSHPQGVTHDAGADTLDDRPLDGATLVDATGAAIGDLEPNAQRKVRAIFRVNEIVEDGTELVFQAALTSDQTPLLGSNIERLVVRSRPVLANSSTLVTLGGAERPRPGDTIAVTATVANAGSSSASEVVVLLAVPEHTTYVPRSARIDGRVVAGVDDNPFDYDNAIVAAERLAPGASVTVEFQVTIDAPLADGTRIKAAGSVGSREVPEFAIASADLPVSSPVDFGGEETALTLLCDDAVTPGMRIPVMLRAVNAGTGTADCVAISFALPPGLIYAPGSAHVDGQPVADDAIPDLTFSVGTLEAGRVVEVGCAATVAVPAPGADLALPVEAALRWKGGERDFARRLTARVAPRFNRARNYVRADRSVAQAGETVNFFVHVYNDGTAAESDLSLRVIPGVHLEDARIGESAEETVPYREPLELGVVPPHYERVFTVTARIATKVPDRSNLTLGAVLEHPGGAIDLGTATIVVRSRPSVARESVAWEVASSEPLRPQRYTDVVVRFTNAGSDVLRDARLELSMPPELVLERAVDARRDRGGLYFGDVTAETTHEARMTLRLVRALRKDRVATIEGWLHGKGISPIQLAPLEVATLAEPQFARSAQLACAPGELVDAGERVHYEIRLRNEGDGPAQSLLVRAIPTNLAVYVPSSTTLNGVPVADDAGTSQLWSHRGLALADVNPGVEIRIRWEMSVMAPLAAGTVLETRAVIEWDGGQTLALAAPALRVQAQPSLGETAIGTPISIARTFPAEEVAYEPPPLPPAEPAYAAAPEVKPAEQYAVDFTPIVSPPAPVEAPVAAEVPVAAEAPVAAEPAPQAEAALEPPAEVPSETATGAAPPPRSLAEVIAEQIERLDREVALEAAPAEPALPAAPPEPALAPGPAEPAPAPAAKAEPPAAQRAPEGGDAPVLYVDFSAEKLDATLRMLDRADAGGLIQHLFAMRLLMPDTAVAGSAQLASAFATANRAMRAPLDRFFVRLRMPRMSVTAKDLEDRDSRFALRSLLDQLLLAPPAEFLPAHSGFVRLEGPIDPSLLRSLSAELDAAPLGAVTPWVINAQLLGSVALFDDKRAETLGRYRGEVLKVLTVLSELPIDEFHRVLTTSVNRSLDESLASVLESLRGAARLTVE